ncbi:MAG: hypothetical protein Q9169_002127 [Polycauliona sp. 2 TL-2023]
MAPPILKKRKAEIDTKRKPSRPSKKIKKQTHYSSSSSADDEPSNFPAINLADSASEEDIDLEDDNFSIDSSKSNEPNPQKTTTLSPSPSSPSTSDTNSDSDAPSNPNQTPLSNPRHNSKRNDPASFSKALTSILASKLPTTKRSDPVLARSSTAQAANREIKDLQIERLAKQSLKAEKRAKAEKGRVKDVLLGGVDTGRGGVMKLGDEEQGGGGEGGEGEGQVGKMVEQERRLKKTAQRGVVKLFNAVRLAQVRGEEARREAVNKGIVGTKRKEEKVGEMSKKGFLELVASGGADGGGKAKAVKMGGDPVEEA